MRQLVQEGRQRVDGAVEPELRKALGLEKIVLRLPKEELTAKSATVQVVDKDGRPLDSPDAWTEQPKAGSTVVLTINHELQEIAERALADHDAHALGARDRGVDEVARQHRLMAAVDATLTARPVRAEDQHRAPPSTPARTSG